MPVTEPAAPFCPSAQARRAAAAWAARLEALGVQLAEADRYVVAIVASREAALEDLQLQLKRTREVGLRLRIHEATRRASLAFAAGLELLERTFGARVGGVALPVAVGGGTAKVLPLVPLRIAGRATPRNKGAAAVEARLLAAIGRAERAGRPPSKGALCAAVRGDSGTVLRVLNQLVSSGQVRKIGRGSKGNPFRYGLGVTR